MLPWSSPLAGRFENLVVDSPALRGNALGDPHERPLMVYLPPGYDEDETRRYPAVYVIQGYTGHLAMWWNRTPFRQPYPELADAMFARGEAPPAIVVFVDAWTSLGGSQLLDSAGTGRYHTYLCDDVVPFVDGRFRTLPGREHRGISGKSSGGYAAMVTAMLRPDLFGALATHAGDALFDVCYRGEFPQRARQLRDRHGGSYPAFLAEFGQRSIPGNGDIELLELYAYAAAYSAEPDGTVRIPFDANGVVIPDVWARWLERDPVVMAGQERSAEALRSMRGIWIDAGRRDEYFLDLGASAFLDRVLAAGVESRKVYFELFDAGHGGIEYRYPLALAWLCRRLAD